MKKILCFYIALAIIVNSVSIIFASESEFSNDLIDTENNDIVSSASVTIDNATESIEGHSNNYYDIDLVLNTYFKYRENSFLNSQESLNNVEFPFSDIVLSDEEIRKEHIISMQDKMEINIVDAQVSYNINSTETVDDFTTLDIYEWTMFDYDDLEDNEYNIDTSGYGVDHIICLQNINGEYYIYSDSYYDMYILNMKSSSYEDNSKEELFIPADNLNISSASPDIDLDVSATSSGLISNAAGYSGYNPDAAAAYSDKYALNYNSSYKSYASSGGDCANFVSQCLTEGGLPNTSSWKPYTSYWVSAGGLKNYLSSTYGGLVSSAGASDIKKGNPVFYPSSAASSGWHATICAGYNSAGTPVINSHTENVYHVKYTYFGTPTTVQIDGSSDHNPIGCFDSVTNGTGYIKVRGWAFDKDNTSQALSIHVYIGGPAGSGEGHILTANTERTDVNTAYGCGNYHGFDEKIPTKKTGSQSVYVYAINIGSGTENTCLGSKLATITKDSTAPKISNVSVSQSSTGYTVTCTATDSDSGVEKVQFPTWTTNNGQDDIFASWQTNSKASGSRSGDTFTYTVKYSDHNNEKGEYNTHIYAYDFSGNAVSYGLTVTPTAAPSGYNISADKNSTYVYNNDSSNQVTVSCTPYNNVSCTAKLIVERSGSVIGSYDFGTGTSLKKPIVFTETGTYEIYFELSNAGGTFKGSKGNGSLTITVTEAPKKYTITYNANGGSGAPGSQTKTHGTNLTLSSTKPTRAYYTFSKWNTKADGSGTSYSPGATYSANSSATLYAIWSPYKHTVAYNANGGSGAPASQTKTYGVQMNLSSTKPTRTGYTFKGWATSSTGTVKYQPGDNYTPDQNGGTVTLYAIWEANTYTITYNANGGAGAPGSQTKTYGATLTLSSTKPTRSGYTFVNWNTKADGSGSSYASGASYSANSSATLYAIWSKNDSLLISVGNVTGQAGSTVDVPVNISNNPGIAAIGFNASYDTAAMTLASVKVGDVFTSSEITEGVIDKNPYTVSAMCATGNKTANGTIVTLTFNLKSNCASGAYSIKISNYEAYNISEKSVNITASNGSITVSDTLIGDINGDKVINRNDLLRFGKYFAGQDVEINKSAADINNDGSVNRNDLLRLGKYFAGWDVKLG